MVNSRVSTVAAKWQPLQRTLACARPLMSAASRMTFASTSLFIILNLATSGAKSLRLKLETDSKAVSASLLFEAALRNLRNDFEREDVERREDDDDGRSR